VGLEWKEKRCTVIAFRSGGRTVARYLCLWHSDCIVNPTRFPAIAEVESFPPRLTPTGSEANQLVFVQKKTPLIAARNFKLRLTDGLEHAIINAEAIAVVTCKTILSHHHKHLGVAVIAKLPKMASNSQKLVGIKSVTTPLQMQLLTLYFKQR
jgi:hypothetical protein